MMQNDPLSILTPFLLKSARKWDSAAPKTKSGNGVGGGPKMTIWAKYFILHDILLILHVVLLCICLKSKNPLSKVS